MINDKYIKQLQNLQSNSLTKGINLKLCEAKIRNRSIIARSENGKMC